MSLILITFNRWIRGGNISYSKRMHLMRYARYERVLRASVFRKQLRFVKRTNWFLAIGWQNIWNNVVHRTQRDCYGHRQVKKTGRESSQAVERALFRWTDARRTGWFPFRDVTKSGKVRRKGPDNEACWSLTLNLTTKTINIRMAKTGVVNVSCNNYMEQSQRQCPKKKKNCWEQLALFWESSPQLPDHIAMELCCLYSVLNSCQRGRTYVTN